MVIGGYLPIIGRYRKETQIPGGILEGNGGFE
jgi:hypothetical protein